MFSRFTLPVVARFTAGWLTAPLVVQVASPEPDSFFWAGLLTALVPMLILGALGGVAVRLYIRERGRADEERSEEASGQA